MFANAYQSGFISIFFSVGSNPLAIWEKQVKNGHIRRVIDDEVKSLVLDIGGTNVATTYITCPIKPKASLGIKLPFFVMVIKNMKKYFSFEIQILDDKDMRRRFRVSNFQSTTKVRPFCTTMPIGLSAGWNQVQFNLADFTKRAYGSAYIETVRVQIHANVRIRRIYFTDQLHSDEELPNEFKLFAPGPREKTKIKEKKPSKEALDSSQGEPSVPPIKVEPKPEEEIPPPPSPAEESPVVQEEPLESPLEVEGAVPFAAEGEVAEGESPPESEAVPAEESEETAKLEGAEAAEGGEPAGNEEAPAEGEGEVEGVVETSLEGEAGELPAGEQPPAEGEIPPTEGVEPATEGETPVVGETPVEGEIPVEGAATEVTEEPPSEAPPEPGVEDTTEVSETVAETTEVTTEVTDTEVSPSEPDTTENEEDA